MKAFQFRLQRVLELRESEAKTEEAALEHLYSERRRLEGERDDLISALARMSGAAHSEQFLQPGQLLALDRYQAHVKRELVVFASKLTTQNTAIEKQRARVIAARGRVKLLEKLREKRHKDWENDCDRELEELTADFSTAQWLRNR